MAPIVGFFIVGLLVGGLLSFSYTNHHWSSDYWTLRSETIPRMTTAARGELAALEYNLLEVGDDLIVADLRGTIEARLKEEEDRRKGLEAKANFLLAGLGLVLPVLLSGQLLPKDHPFLGVLALAGGSAILAALVSAFMALRTVFAKGYLVPSKKDLFEKLKASTPPSPLDWNKFMTLLHWRNLEHAQVQNDAKATSLKHAQTSYFVAVTLALLFGGVLVLGADGSGDGKQRRDPATRSATQSASRAEPRAESSASPRPGGGKRSEKAGAGTFTQTRASGAKR